ncbi:histidinol dehydrogenase [Candidatus Woesearchaeota archaeon]|nr:histidinol dehydrogenase [Candidatus Woesearchaeota archaeon]
MEKEKMKEINKVVDKIIEDVKNNGDAAIRYYTNKFDKIGLNSFLVTKQEVKEAYKQVNKKTIKALKFAKKNIEFFAKQQFKQFRNFEVRKNGIILGQRVIPIEKIGVYIPGGNYPLTSTALMCIVPARLVGVKEIIACSPKINAETIVAADIAGADKIFKIGGVQAIAAMAYGTNQIPKVDKIVGPGNVYVTAAKKAVYGDCGIDFLAGPSEIMIIAEKSADYRFVAIDLLAQLEHDINSRAFLITNSKILIKNVKDEIKKQLLNLATKNIVKKSIKNLKIILAKKMENAVEIANKIAPEHLELQIKNPEKYIEKLRNYGSLFIGKYSAEAFGDYCSGTNHVLPTNGGARFTSGLSVRDFIKLQTYQKINLNGVRKLTKSALKLSQIECLDAHNKSIQIRLQKKPKHL